MRPEPHVSILRASQGSSRVEFQSFPWPNGFEAKTYYAGVGLGHGKDYAKPVLKDQEYTMVYKGLQEIK